MPDPARSRRTTSRPAAIGAGARAAEASRFEMRLRKGYNIAVSVHFSGIGKGEWHENTHTGFDGSGDCAGNDRHGGERANPGVGCGRLHGAPQKHDADRHTGVMSWKNRLLWLRPRVCQRLS